MENLENKKWEKFGHGYAWVMLGKLMALLDDNDFESQAKQRLIRDLWNNARPMQDF